MPIDLALVKTVLQALRNNAGRGVTAEVVAIDCEVILRRPMLAHQVQSALQECRARGWAECDTDTWGQELWTIAAAGANAEPP